MAAKLESVKNEPKKPVADIKADPRIVGTIIEFSEEQIIRMKSAEVVRDRTATAANKKYMDTLKVILKEHEIDLDKNDGGKWSFDDKTCSAERKG